MNLKESYFHYQSTLDLMPFIDNLNKNIVCVFVSRRYYLLDKIPGFKKIKRAPYGEEKDKLCIELIGYLIELLFENKFFNRFLTEDSITNMESFIYHILKNSLNLSRYDEFNRKLIDLFDSHKDKYYFWIGRERVRCTDFSEKHKYRNYYPASCNDIPELFLNSLSEILGESGINNWYYVHGYELVNLIDDSFFKTDSSLRIKHFMDFFIDIKFIEPETIPASETPNEDEVSRFNQYIIQIYHEPNFETLNTLDSTAFVSSFFETLNENERNYLYWFALAVKNNWEAVGDFDLYREASLLEQEGNSDVHSPNSYRNYIYINQNSIFKRYEHRFTEEFGNDMKQLSSSLKVLIDIVLS